MCLVVQDICHLDFSNLMYQKYISIYNKNLTITHYYIHGEPSNSGWYESSKYKRSKLINDTNLDNFKFKHSCNIHFIKFDMILTSFV